MTLEKVCAKIDKYLNNDSHQPIMVNVAATTELCQLENHYNVGHIFVKASKYVNDADFLMMDQLKNEVQTQHGVVFLTELSTYLKLQGENELKSQLRALLDIQLEGKLVVITHACQKFIKKFDRRLFDTSRIMFIGASDDANPARIFFISKRIPLNYELMESAFAHSLRELPVMLEKHNYEDVIAITELKKSDVPNALLDIREVSSSHEALVSSCTELKNLNKDLGTEEQWSELLRILQYKNYEWNAIEKNPNLLKKLHSDGTASSLNAFVEWIQFIIMKLHGAKGNEYLTAVIAKSKTLGEYNTWLYDYLLEIDANDGVFQSYYKERKELLSNYEENSNFLISYCKKVTAKESQALYYLTDNTNLEKETIIKSIDGFVAEHSREELEDTLKTVYPALADYLSPYNYSQFSEYFDQYKYSKLINKMTPRFTELAEQEVLEKRFLDMPPRAKVIDKMEKKNSHLYFVDALGVEFLAYIQEQCYKRTLDFTAKIGYCNLPSITSMNKEFVDEFSSYTSIKSLDELKHDEQFDYNYEKVKQPIHLVKELAIIDEVMSRIDSDLQQGSLEKVFIVSDHGASRMAVIAESENKWEMSEKGQHSGRCCPKSDIDVKPDCAIDENDFYCLLNYDRFKGGRKANVEVHGGASLEEVLVPIIEVTKRSQAIECKLDKGSKIVTSSFKKIARIRIYLSKTLDDVSILVDGKYYYNAQLVDSQQYLYEIALPDVKKAGTHTFDVLVGESYIAKDISFEMKKEGANERKFF